MNKKTILPLSLEITVWTRVFKALVDCIYMVFKRFFIWGLIGAKLTTMFYHFMNGFHMRVEISFGVCLIITFVTVNFDL